MSTASAPKTAPQKTKSSTSNCCANSGCGSGLRNRYFVGKQLSPYSFQVEQRHTLERRRQLNRALYGWGVVYGFDLVKTPSCSLTIKPGLALDPCGRELLQLEELSVAVEDLIVFDKDCHLIEPDSRVECWLLSAHYAEQDSEEVRVSDPCQCEHTEWNYTCETVRFSLQSMDCADCCKGQGCEWKCEGESCKCEPKGWCDPSGDTRQRGGYRYLCDYGTKVTPGAECESWREISEPCGSVRVDLGNGVPLACVKLVRNNCDGWGFGEVDACSPRRLVKRNDLLFDLIQGCDLTTITKIGWAPWHRQKDPIDFDEFSRAFGPKGDDQPEYVTEDFWVEFSRPVRRDTLQPDCFAMTVFYTEREGGWLQSFRVPIVKVDTKKVPAQPGDPQHHVRSARLIVDGGWVEDGLRGRKTVFQDSETRIEIEVRGDFIIDCNGQAVDANAVGCSPVPTGNGTSGGTFLSTFGVARVP
jgi:hypothetical protein